MTKKIANLLSTIFAIFVFVTMLYLMYTKVDVSGFNNAYLSFVSSMNSRELQDLINSSYSDKKVTFSELTKIMSLHEDVLDAELQKYRTATK